MNTCRCASRSPSPGESIAKFPMGRCSTSSCSTCAAIADRTARIWRRPMGRQPTSSARRKSLAAHYYDPNRAVFQDFEPFWEFMSGPLHAGTWRPQTLDNTFGPRAVFQQGCSGAQRDDLAPCCGLQFFGHVAIDGASDVMTVTLKDVADRDLWSTTIEPRMEKWSRGVPSMRS